MEESINQIKHDINPYQYSPLALAYLGDSVLDLMVKNHFVLNSNKQSYKYHKDVTNIVKAVNQAAFVDKYQDCFADDELNVYKRGRNSSTHSKAKNASQAEYKKATGLEALIGYLYLTGKTDRLNELVNMMISDYESGQ